MGEARFTVVEGNGAETCIPAEPQIICVALTKEIADRDMRRIDSEDNGGVGSVINGVERRRGEKRGLEHFLSGYLFGTEDKRCIFAG